MSDIHYFPRYSQKENMVTNNTLLLFSRLYQNSPQKFSLFINSVLEESGVELDTTVGFKQQEKAKNGNIPDGLIEQESFKVVIETKLYGQEGIKQIKGHWEAFEDEDNQVFLLINKENITREYHKKIITELNKYNEKKGRNIVFASTTFKEMCSSFSDILEEYEIEMTILIEDYKKFCNETKLIDNADTKLFVVLTGTTYDENLEYGLYFHPRKRGYQNSRYIGLYKSKAIRAIGEIIAIVDAKYNLKKNALDYLEVVNGTPPKDIGDRILRMTVDSKEKHGYNFDEARRYFVVNNYYNTKYKKVSKGGLMGRRYIDLSELPGFNEQMDAEKIALLLNGKKWGIK